MVALVSKVEEIAKALLLLLTVVVKKIPGCLCHAVESISPVDSDVKLYELLDDRCSIIASDEIVIFSDEFAFLLLLFRSKHH